MRITVNFHPDRHTRLGVLTLEALAREGRYRSQFETGTSSGGLTAHPGGDRWHWESRMFGGAYDDADSADRPIYGALDDRFRSLGGAPRFGSAYLRLTSAVLDRASFCFPDSHLDPQAFGTGWRCDLLDLARLARHAGTTAERAGGDPLDGYVEAQVHGQLEICRDVEALVLDPSHRSTSVECAARVLGIPIEWHEGRLLDVETLVRHVGYRGSEPVRLGLAVARAGVIDARIIGDASRTGAHDAQVIKQLWHLTARFGRAASAQLNCSIEEPG